MRRLKWISESAGGVPNWLWIYFGCMLIAVILTVFFEIFDQDDPQPIDPVPVVTVTVTVTETVGWR